MQQQLASILLLMHEWRGAVYASSFAAIYSRPNVAGKRKAAMMQIDARTVNIHRRKWTQCTLQGKRDTEYCTRVHETGTTAKTDQNAGKD